MNENDIIEAELPPIDEDAQKLEEQIELEEINNEKEDPPTPQEQIEILEATISELEAKLSSLEDKNAAQARVMEELGDFSALFPDVSIDSIPESIWDDVKNGASLPAAYALYEKRYANEQKRIAAINAQNASRSAGRIGSDTASEYFSPEDVRKMSRAEVHANYSKIKESMKKWM